MGESGTSDEAVQELVRALEGGAYAALRMWLQESGHLRPQETVIACVQRLLGRQSTELQDVRGECLRRALELMRGRENVTTGKVLETARRFEAFMLGAEEGPGDG